MNGEAFEADRAADGWLVIAAQAGDRRAIERLVRRWHRRLVAHGWRLTGDRAMAEEAVQAAWIDILRGISALRDARAFPAWAYRIVTRKTATAIGHRVAGRALATALEDDAPPPQPSPEDTVDGTTLRCAVAALPPGHRAAVALHYFEGLSIAETAVALGIPSGTVKTRLLHAAPGSEPYWKETPMRDHDIDAAIAAEERELLRQIGEEPGYLTQVGSLFGGRLGWTSAVVLVAQTLVFFAGVYAAWRFFAATETLEALRWGLPAMTLIIVATIFKAAMLPVLHIQRVLRALARLGIGTAR